MITAVREIKRKPKRLKAWQHNLVTEMKLDLLSFLADECHKYTKKYGKELVSKCKKELSKYGYDTNRIDVICDERNNTRRFMD